MFHPDMHWLLGVLHHWGYLGIFVLLMTGIIGIPWPDELLMLSSGFLCSQGELWLPGTILAGTAGSICGITLSYVLGRVLGLAVLHRYGRYVGLSQAALDRGHRWFVRYGKWSVVVGYFVPGFRHLVAISAGATLLELKFFLPFACIGVAALGVHVRYDRLLRRTASPQARTGPA